MARSVSGRLVSGDTIALFSPSSPGPLKYPDRYRQGIVALKKIGFIVKEGATCRTRVGFRSAPPAERAAEFNSFLTDETVAGILMTIGGFNTVEILPYIEYDLAARHPKVICGYSDASVLLNALYARAGVITYHGPALLPSFGEYPEPMPETVSSFLDVAMGWPSLQVHLPESWTDEFLDWTTDAWRSRPRRRYPSAGPIWYGASCPIEGTLIGGNLDSLLTTVGTEYWPTPLDPILFFENTERSLERWAMEIWALKIRGILSTCSALLVGKHEGMPPHLWPQVDRIILEALQDVAPEMPVVTQIDLGHTAPMVTLPVGGRIRIEPNPFQITLLEW